MRVRGAFLPLDTANAALVKRGEVLAKIGSEARGVPGCDNCHGRRCWAVADDPVPCGQYGHYIAFELKMWQRGFRKTSPDAMALFAKQLDDHDVAAVAAYYQQLRGPAARERVARVALMAVQAEEPIPRTSMRRIGPRLIRRSTSPLQSERRPPRRRSRTVHAARC